VVVALALHLMVLAFVLFTPKFPAGPAVPDTPDEVAQVELLLGQGAQQTGTPPPAPQSAEAPVQPQDSQTPPPQEPVPPDDAGAAVVERRPPAPSVEAPPAPQAAPTPAPASQAAPASIRLGDGIAAPPAEIFDQFSFLEAGPDAKNTAPEYPLEAARRREEGEVVLALHIDAQGKVVRVEILHSSGSPRLDQAAQRQLGTWHYRPAIKDGVAVPSIVQQSIDFRI
jgi:protein TonB